MKGGPHSEDKALVGCLLAAVFGLAWALVLALSRSSAQPRSSLPACSPGPSPIRRPRPPGRARIAVSLAGLLGAFVVGVFANHAYTVWRTQAAEKAELAALGYIAYVRDGNIHTCRADGARDRLLVRGANCRGLLWGPQGDKLAFVRQYHVGECKAVALYAVDITKSHLTKLTRDLPGVAEHSRIGWAERQPLIAFDYTPANVGTRGADSAVVQAACGPGWPRECIFANCRCPCISPNGGLLALHDLLPTTHTQDFLVSLACLDNVGPSLPGQRRVDDLVTADDEELQAYGYAMEDLSLCPTGDCVSFRMRWNAGGTLWLCEFGETVQLRRACSLEDVAMATWNPSGTALVVWKLHNSTSSEAAASSEGLYWVDPANGIARQLVGGLRRCSLSVDTQCWSHDGRWLVCTDHTGQAYGSRQPTATRLLDVETGKLVALSEPGVGLPRLQPVPCPLAPADTWVFEDAGTLRKMRKGTWR